MMQTSVIGTFPLLLTARTTALSLLSVGFAPSDISLVSIDPAPESDERDLSASQRSLFVATSNGRVVTSGMPAGAREGRASLEVITQITRTPNGHPLPELLTDDMIEVLIGMGISGGEAKHIYGELKDGSAFISVNCDTFEEILRVKTELTSTGAHHILSTSWV